MGNHKRKKPKHQRAGCLMCKPHKDERAAKENKASVERQLDDLDKLIAERTLANPDFPALIKKALDKRKK